MKGFIIPFSLFTHINHKTFNLKKCRTQLTRFIQITLVHAQQALYSANLTTCLKVSTMEDDQHITYLETNLSGLTGGPLLS
jgi:3-oxoacyl-(acyl-carrier-protein) synthase